MSEERKILSSMITNTEYLTQLRDVAQTKYFKSSYSQIVAGWVWEYFEHTQQAPGSHIEDIYVKNRHLLKDEEDNELVAEFLSKLSEDHIEIKNIKYAVKSAVEFFKLRSVELFKQEVESALAEKNPNRAEKLIADFRRLDTIQGRGVNLLRDPGSIRLSFLQDHEFLFKFPGVLGQTLGMFKRGDFFAWMGSPKRGKTWYLIYTATRAVLMGYRVVFISLEMNEEPIIRRFWKGFTGQPEKPERVDIPIFKHIKNKYEIKSKNVKKKGLNFEEVEKQQKKYIFASRGGELRIQTYPSYSASVQDIEDYLTNLEYYEGLIPDVIVVDYADILKPGNARLDYRHQLDNIWKSLRGIAQEKEALVVTATQSGRKGLTGEISESDVAEDMRKMAHITKMVILNQNEKEKDAGIIRMKPAAQREERSFSAEIAVLQSLEIGRPYIDSRLVKSVNMEPFQKDKKSKK